MKKTNENKKKTGQSKTHGQNGKTEAAGQTEAGRQPKQVCQHQEGEPAGQLIEAWYVYPTNIYTNRIISTDFQLLERTRVPAQDGEEMVRRLSLVFETDLRKIIDELVERRKSDSEANLQFQIFVKFEDNPNAQRWEEDKD